MARPGFATGALGVLGPTRMAYGRTISAVRYVAGLMSDLVVETFAGYPEPNPAGRGAPVTKHKKTRPRRGLLPAGRGDGRGRRRGAASPVGIRRRDGIGVDLHRGGGRAAPLPVLPAEQVDPSALEAEVTELRAQADEYLDGWQRARAEFANYKKRIERDKKRPADGRRPPCWPRSCRSWTTCERALQRAPPEAEGYRHWAEGIELIQRKLPALLEAEGVETHPGRWRRLRPHPARGGDLRTEQRRTEKGR